MTSEMVENTLANIRFFFHLLDPEIRRRVRRLERLHLKIIKKGESVVFNRPRLDNNSLPKYTAHTHTHTHTHAHTHTYIYIYMVQFNGDSNSVKSS